MATLVAWIMSILLPVVALAQQAAPRFSDYPAVEKYNGKNSTVVLKSKNDREFRTQLRSAAREKPNFAGHYIVAAWGCGSACLMGAVIDANSGVVHWFPHTICCWEDTSDKFRPIDYRLSSRLIVFSGDRNEKEGDDGAHFYEFKDGTFVHIRSIMKPAAQ
jgi:hypothetical protein